ncbi:MAG: DUF2953 domain-containing protein [Clostridia bacterium]|nr:DUF2953 domain-containing protein [Clostridia bacterium]
MIVLKIIGWIICILLLIIAAILAFTILFLSVKIKLKVSVNEEKDKDVRFRLQYGFINLKIYPEQFTEEKKEKYKKLFEKIKAKLSDEEKKEISKIEKQIIAEEKQIEDFNERQTKREALGEDPSKIDELIYEIRQIDFKKIKDIIEKLKTTFTADDLSDISHYIIEKTANLPEKFRKKFIIEKLFFILTYGCANDAAKGAIEYGRICSVVYPFFGKLASRFKLREYDIDMNPDFLSKENQFRGALVCSFRPINFISILTIYGVAIVNKVSGKVIKNKIKNKKTDKVNKQKQVVENN